MTSENIPYTDLVPDYHRGSLEPELKNLFDKELAANPELQEELNEFVQFQKLYHEIDDENPVPSDAIFKRISESVDSLEQNKQREFKDIPSSPALSIKFLEAWAWLKESVSVPWGMAIVQAIVIVILLLPGTPQKSYKTLSVSPETGVNNTRVLFNIVFKDSAKESEIRELLLATNSTITSGPSAQGRYVIALAPGKPTAHVIETLQQADIVIFIEKAL